MRERLKVLGDGCISPRRGDKETILTHIDLTVENFCVVLTSRERFSQ